MSDTSSPDGTPASPPLRTCSAAREVLETPEIRQLILRSLDKRSLTRFMRVQKRCMFSVAQELYHTMGYTAVRSRMSMATTRLSLAPADPQARQRTYCSAVREINCQNLKLAPTMLKQTSFVCTNPKRRTAQTDAFLQQYHIEVFQLVVPPLLRKCENLRRIVFGSEYAYFGRDSWVVHFDPALPATDALPTSSPEGNGHIDFVRHVTLLLERDPPTVIQSPPPPSLNYELRLRFDLKLEGAASLTPGQVNKWHAALKGEACYSAIYKAIDLGALPVTLDFIVDLYDRQISNGFADRLETILAPSVAPWDIEDFRRFAAVASTSLTSLNLTDSRWQLHPEAKLTFTELPAFVSIVRRDLPNLKRLYITMGGIETAEMECRSMLHDDILSARGTLYTLDIVAYPGVYSGPLFNLVRAISSLCNEMVEIDIHTYKDGQEQKGVWGEQGRYLKVLRRQSAEQRCHLSVIDFDTLAVKGYQQVEELAFAEDGRPRKLWESRAIKWHRWIRNALSSRGRLAVDQKDDAHHCLRACHRVIDLPGTATQEEVLRELGTMAESIRSANRSGDLDGIFSYELLGDIDGLGKDPEGSYGRYRPDPDIGRRWYPSGLYARGLY